MNVYLQKDAVHITITGDPTMAATLQQVLDELSSISTSLMSLTSDVADLKAKVGGGGVITQADLDNILTNAQSAADQASALHQTAMTP
jgi:hypothetical protein